MQEEEGLIMRLCGFNKENGYLLLETIRGKMLLKPYADNIIRIRYTRRAEFSSIPSLMTVWDGEEAVEWRVEEDQDTVRLLTGELQVEISRETCAFTYKDARGNLLVKEPDRGGKSLVPVDVVVSVFDTDTTVKAGHSVDGMRVSVEDYSRVVDRKAYQAKLEFEWAQDEALYGLGSHEEGIMNLRGHQQLLYQQNMKAVVPMLVSTKGYGLLADNYSLMTFHDDVYGSHLWMDVAEELDYYFIGGPELDRIVGGFRKLTGETPMLPKWAFGYIQSKERYETQAELIDIVSEYRKRRIPLDMIVLDWKSWTGELWGQKTFDPDRFPDPVAMMEKLHSMDARLMVSIWPIMNTGGQNHAEMQENDYLLGNRATYDAFNDKARAMYWKHANDGLFSKGIDAWWCDCTEPFEADWKGEVKPEPEERLLINAGEAKKYLDPAYINAYSLLHSRGIYEGQRQVTEEKRVVNLTRSAYAGQHRYSAVTWSGDIAANWQTLKKQIPAGLNFCATGEPYWTVDIGAFFVRNRDDLWFWEGDYDYGSEDMGYRELYVRWFQYGAFLPMFRSHGTDTPREVWRFGEPGTVFYDTLVKFIYLRYRLLPYIYSVAARVTFEAYTMLRALAFDFRRDSRTYDIGDQYMFGPALLVSPVTTPMYYDKGSRKLENTQKSRSVYLPEGCKWYDFWTGTGYEGGQVVEADAPLDIMPLFVKAGSIIPMGPEVQHTGEKPGAPLELRIYPGADGSFTLYEDEGDGYAYEKGAYATVKMTWNDGTRRLVLEDRQGSYAGMPESRVFNIVTVSGQNGAGADEAGHFTKTAEYRGARLVIDL